MTRLIRWACLGLLNLAACFRSDLEPTRLGDLPDLRIVFAANSASIWVQVEFNAGKLGGCALLDDSFHATVGDTELPISSPGRVQDPELPMCEFPRLRLEPPPIADSVVLADDSKQITFDLGGRLARPIHDQPWLASPGETATMPVTPAGALSQGNLQLVLETASLTAGFPGTKEDVPFTTSSDQVQFVVPDRPGSHVIALRSKYEDGGVPKPWPCLGATCQVVGQTVLPLGAPIEIRTPPAI